MAGVRAQPYCSRCSEPVVRPHLRYCSDSCAHEAELELRREREARRPKRDRREQMRAAYRRIKADPEQWAKRQAYQKAYAAAHRERYREYHRRWRERLTPERREEILRLERERKARWAQQHPEARRRIQHESYRRLRADARRWAKQLEGQRLNYRLRQERNGRPVPPVPEHRYPAPSSQWTIGAEPLRDLLREVLNGSRTLRELSAASGVPERTLGRLINGDGNVAVATADRLLVALGLHLDLIYEEP